MTELKQQTTVAEDRRELCCTIADSFATQLEMLVTAGIISPEEAKDMAEYLVFATTEALKPGGAWHKETEPCCEYCWGKQAPDERH